MGCLQGFCLHPKEKELKEVQDRKKQAQNRLQAQQNILAQKRQQIDNLNRKITTVTTSSENSRNQIKKVQTEIDVLTRTTSDLSTQRYSTKITMQTNQKNFKQLQQRLSKLPNRLSASSKNKNPICKVKDTSEELKNIQNQIKQSEQQLRTLCKNQVKSVKSQNKMIENLRKDLRQKDDRIAKLDRQILGLQTQLNEIKAESSSSIIDMAQTGMLDHSNHRLLEEDEHPPSLQYLNAQDIKFQYIT